MSKIWVVMGTTGEYSDRNDWPVVAFPDKARAEARIVACTQEANKRFSESQVPDESNDWSSYNTDNNVLDPNMKMDYTGTSYFHYEVEIEQ